MDLLNFFRPKNSLKTKILHIKHDIKSIISKVCMENFWVAWYGAYEIDPKHLVFWICVESDKLKLNLKSNPVLITTLKDLLIKHNYPDQARKLVIIDFESQETVDRESGGDWHLHFK